MPRLRISLANKCQILFGAAVLLIVVAALAVPWYRLTLLVTDAQRQIARQLADAYLADQIQLGGLRSPNRAATTTDGSTLAGLQLIMEDRFLDAAEQNKFVMGALERFADTDAPLDLLTVDRTAGDTPVYRYARAVRSSDLQRLGDPSIEALPTGSPDKLRAVIVIALHARWADQQLLLNRVYAIVAGILAVALAIAVFWLITTRLILSPVRVLRDTAEKVAQGDLGIRSDINTGDEFEQLSLAFNSMLSGLKGSQDKLRELNRQLDLKLGELAESNLNLYEANRVKGDFLANVSHELRTPLNSIIGFAEVLAEAFAAREDSAGEKHHRYIQNILTSGRSLLQLITELLDLARIEAGRVELHPEALNLRDNLEVLANLIRPQADRRGLALKLALPRDLPTITTDPGKLQQIIFNFLSNAVKFTPTGGDVELGAEAVRDRGGNVTFVRIHVRDNGPGIPHDRQEVVFEKFRQLAASEVKEHGGAGLGLAISRELAKLLQGRIELDSRPGQGATFTLVIPAELKPEVEEALIPDNARGVSQV